MPWPPYTPPPKPTPEERFWAKVDASRGPEECWPWLGSKNPNGYGSFDRGWAHRFAYLFARGPIPPGLAIDHLCGQRYCVNPRHLEAVTTATNVRRGYLKNVAGVLRRDLMAQRTHCLHGHELTPDNVYVTKQGWRQCRTCRRNTKQRARMRAQKE